MVDIFSEPESYLSSCLPAELSTELPVDLQALSANQFRSFDYEEIYSSALAALAASTVCKKEHPEYDATGAFPTTAPAPNTVTTLPSHLLAIDTAAMYQSVEPVIGTVIVPTAASDILNPYPSPSLADTHEFTKRHESKPQIELDVGSITVVPTPRNINRVGDASCNIGSAYFACSAIEPGSAHHRTVQYSRTHDETGSKQRCSLKSGSQNDYKGTARKDQDKEESYYKTEDDGDNDESTISSGIREVVIRTNYGSATCIDGVETSATETETGPNDGRKASEGSIIGPRAGAEGSTLKPLILLEPVGGVKRTLVQIRQPYISPSPATEFATDFSTHLSQQSPEHLHLLQAPSEADTCSPTSYIPTDRPTVEAVAPVPHLEKVTCDDHIVPSGEIRVCDIEGIQNGISSCNAECSLNELSLKRGRSRPRKIARLD